MSTNKKKTSLDLQQICDSIKGKALVGLLQITTIPFFSEILITTKLRLEDPKPEVLPNLIRDLHMVASLAESFTEHRQRSNKSWIHLVDVLDQEGMFDPSPPCCLSG